MNMWFGKNRRVSLLAILLLITTGLLIISLVKPVNLFSPNARDFGERAESSVVSAAASKSALVNVADFGAAGDGKTDDYKGIVRAVSRAAALKNDGLETALLFPEATAYASSGTIEIPANISVIQKAPLIYTGNEPKPFLVLGSEDETSTATYSGLSVIKRTSTDWKKDGKETGIGISIINASNSRIEVAHAENFTIGVQTAGIGKGFVYNKVELGKIASNKIGLKITNKTNGSGAKGWNNENIYLNGNFAVWSNVNEGESRYGVLITSEDGSYLNNNNNVFLKPSFELNDKSLTSAKAESIPIVIEHGLNNSFEYVRNEGNGAYVARVMNNSNNNVISVAYGDAAIEDVSEFGNQVLRDVNDQFLAQFQLAYSFPLLERYTAQNQTRAFRGMTFLDENGKELSSTTGDCIGLDGGFVSFGRGCVALGVKLDTSSVKQFVIKRAASDDMGGRVAVKGFDAQGRQVDGRTAPWIRGTSKNSFFYSENFGGVYLSGADSSVPVYFDVNDKIKSIWVGVASGTNTAKINSIGIFTKQTDYPALLSGLE